MWMRTMESMRSRIMRNRMAMILLNWIGLKNGDVEPHGIPDYFKG